MCTYVPGNPNKRLPLHLSGVIKDISMSGLSLEVSPRRTSAVSHNVGDTFRIETVLPSGIKIALPAKVMNAEKGFAKTRLGMHFDVLPDYSETKKALWFFLLP